MSSNFGTGQGLFGATSNQNKNQTTSTPGYPPPAGASSSPFANLGANTTNSSVFGGSGAGAGPGPGNTPAGGGTTTGPGGNLFGTGGSAFGSSWSTNAATPNPSGAGAGATTPFGGGLFAAKPATTTGPAGVTTGGTQFPNASSNPGTPGTMSGPGLFGNNPNTNTNTGATGGSMFNFPKPAASGGSLFGPGLPGSTGTSGSGAAGITGTMNAASGAGPPSATGSTTPAATGMTTGSNTLGGGLFGNTKPADSTAKPATSSFFTPPTTATGSSTGAAPAGSSLFSGLGPKPSETSTSSPAPSSTLLGGSTFKPPGSSTSATAPAINTQPPFSLGGSTATAPTTGTAGGGFFSNLGATANKDGMPEAKKDGASTTLPTFSLGGQPTGTATAAAAPTTEKRDGMAAPSLFSGLGGATSGATKPATPLAGSTSAPAAGQLSLTTTSTSAISVPSPSMLKGKGIEEIINRWSTDLETHVRDFNRFATEVAVWDRALIENGNNLATLYSHVLAAEREQNDIDQSLDHIEQQEKELNATVEMYEKQMADILGGQGGTLRTLDTGPADTERDKNYMLATELHNHLDDLSSSLTQLIDSVNTMSIGQGDSNVVSADDPMAQIAQVLSNHLESLQWIDGASRELEEKVVEVDKRIKDVGGVSQSTPTLGGGSRSRGFGLNR